VSHRSAEHRHEAVAAEFIEGAALLEDEIDDLAR
jgi:hypothetical protein